jgi:hypothetical protein
MSGSGAQATAACDDDARMRVQAGKAPVTKHIACPLLLHTTTPHICVLCRPVRIVLLGQRHTPQGAWSLVHFITAVLLPKILNRLLLSAFLLVCCAVMNTQQLEAEIADLQSCLQTAQHQHQPQQEQYLRQTIQVCIMPLMRGECVYV